AVLVLVEDRGFHGTCTSGEKVGPGALTPDTAEGGGRFAGLGRGAARAGAATGHSPDGGGALQGRGAGGRAGGGCAPAGRGAGAGRWAGRVPAAADVSRYLPRRRRRAVAVPRGPPAVRAGGPSGPPTPSPLPPSAPAAGRRG